MRSDPHMILRVVAKGLIPLIILFALYVQFHGEYSPGGGFQAGVLMAVAIILHSLIFGITATMKAIPPIAPQILSALGVVIYAGTGVLSLFADMHYLNYDVVGQIPGIITIEIGVLFAVSGAMVSIFYAFAGRAPDIADEDW